MKFFKQYLTIKAFWFKIFLISLQCIFIGNNLFAQTLNHLPNKVVYVYNQSIFTEDSDAIFEQIKQGNYTDTIFYGPPTIVKSAWVYIPREVIEKDTLRNYVLTGYFDYTDLYKMVKGNWQKVAHGGCYIKFSEISTVSGRYYFKLFNNSNDIADGYLIACRRKNDYTSSLMQGELLTFKEVADWNNEYQISKEWFNRIVLPFWGVLLLTTIVLLARFVLSKDKAYLLYAIGNFLFIVNSLLIYFLEPVNIKNYPFNDPALGISLSGPAFILGVGGFILSFKYFYNDRRSELLKVVNKGSLLASILCLLLAILNFILNYYFEFYYYTNIVMYIFLAVLMIIIYSVLYYYRKILNTFPVTTSFVVIMIGSLFLSLFAVVGFIVSEVYGQNTIFIGKFHLLSFPLLIGVSIYNAFILMGFSGRDYRIYEEANLLKVKAQEYEIRVLQNSLNPHFIFNSLSLIDFFVYRKDLPQARNTLFRFSDLLRMVIDKTGEKAILLTDELKMIDLYLKLECSRNKDVFTYSIEQSEDINNRNIKIPPMLLQPIVENAVKHGILNKDEIGGHISIILKIENDFLLIEVRDNGIGFKKSLEFKSVLVNDRKHLGMDLTKRRLELISEKCELIIKDLQEGKGASVLIKISLE